MASILSFSAGGGELDSPNSKSVSGIGKSSKPAFSVAEAMITLLIVSIALAAAAPLFTRKAKTDTASSYMQIPSGMVAFFNLSTCPTGWQAANGSNGTVDLRGRFVRGSGTYNVCGWDSNTNSYTNCTNQQTLDVGTTQEDAIRQITGSLDLMGYQGTGSHKGTFWSHPTYNNDGGNDSTNENNGTAPSRIDFDSGKVVPFAVENRPRNIALLACIKK